MKYSIKELGLEKTIFYSLLLIHVLYVWIVPVFLTQDGPSHLYNSKILLDLFLGNGNDVYQQYLEFNLHVFPNWFSSIILSSFLSIFSPIIAEKFFISLLIAAIPLSFRYALKSINPNAIFLSSLTFIISNSYFLTYGFYNFQWSLVLFCVFIGYYYKSYSTLSVKQSIWLSILLILTFTTHPVALIQMYFLLGLEFIKCLFSFFNKNTIDKKEVAKRVLRIVLIVLPSMLLLGIFFYNQHSNSKSLLENNLSFQSLKTLLIANHLWVFSSIERILFGLFSIIVFIYAGIAYLKRVELLKNQHSINMIILLIFNVLIYFFISDQLTGGAYLNIRITIFIYILLIMYTASLSFRSNIRKIHIIGSAALCLTLIIVRFPYQNKIGVLAKQYITIGDNIEDGATLLPLSFSNNGGINSTVLSPTIAIFKHMSGYIGASKKIISFDNYEANTAYFPLIWKEFYNPYKNISAETEGGIEECPPSVDITSFNKRKLSSIDYILLWGDQSNFYGTEKYTSLSEQLKKEYKLIRKSDDGLTFLYTKK